MIIECCPKCRLISFIDTLFTGNFGQFIFRFSLALQSSIGASLLTRHSYLKTNLNKEGDRPISNNDIDIVSIITGSLLGCGQAKKKKNGSGTRVSFFEEAKHVSYLLWLHNQIASAGYCSTITPRIGKKLGKGGKLLKTIRFSTFSYTSFDWIHNIWYTEGVKVIPKSLGNHLTPLALAILIMDSGVKVSGGLRLITSSFSYSDLLFLVQVLYNNFEIKASIQSTGVSSRYTVYIGKEYMTQLRDIVSPYIIKEMKYKLLP